MYGDDYMELFHEFSTKPIASGCIAQVYKAVLKDGTPVAVKVRHPNIEGKMKCDLALMSAVAYLVRR